jgi:hypothetical protein
MNKLIISVLFLAQTFMGQAQKRFDLTLFKDKGKVGIKERNDNIIIPATFDNAFEQFSNNLVAVQKGKKWGYIDTLGKLVVPYKYDQASDFNKAGLAIVYMGSEGEHAGCVDKHGNEIVPAIYDDLFFADGNGVINQANTFIATLKNKKTILDMFGKLKFIIVYDEMKWIYMIGGGFYIVQKQKKVGTIDENGKMIIPLKYESIEYDERYAIRSGIKRLKVKLNDKDGFLDLTGKEL